MLKYISCFTLMYINAIVESSYPNTQKHDELFSFKQYSIFGCSCWLTEQKKRGAQPVPSPPVCTWTFRFSDSYVQHWRQSSQSYLFSLCAPFQLNQYILPISIIKLCVSHKEISKIQELLKLADMWNIFKNWMYISVKVKGCFISIYKFLVCINHSWQ